MGRRKSNPNGTGKWALHVFKGLAGAPRGPDALGELVDACVFGARTSPEAGYIVIEGDVL